MGSRRRTWKSPGVREGGSRVSVVMQTDSGEEKQVQGSRQGFGESEENVSLSGEVSTTKTHLGGGWGPHTLQPQARGGGGGGPRTCI